MIYIEDNHQDKLVDDSDFSMDIKGDPKVLATELAMVLDQLYEMDSRIVRAAITAFWKEVQDDSRTE